MKHLIHCHLYLYLSIRLSIERETHTYVTVNVRRINYYYYFFKHISLRAIMSLLHVLMITLGLVLHRSFVPSSTSSSSHHLHHNPPGNVSQVEHHAFVDFDFSASTNAEKATWLKWVFCLFYLCFLFLLRAAAGCPIATDRNKRSVAVVWLENKSILVITQTNTHKHQSET